MRADRDTEFGSQQQYRQYFVDSAEPATIDLTNADSSRLQKLFKHDAIRTVFTRRDLDWSDRLRNRQMSQDIVGTGGFFDKPGFELG